MDFRIEDTNYYKFLKEEIEMLIECYEEEKYEKLNKQDITNIIEEVMDNDYLSETINEIIIDELNRKCRERGYEE